MTTISIKSHLISDANGLNTHDLDGLERLTELEKILFLDTVGYLPGDILTKVDRASMYSSLETRALLDHRLCEFSWSIPNEFKLREGETKWILRQVQREFLPEELTRAPKMGFGIPIEDLLRTSLFDWANGWLSSKKLGQMELFDLPAIEKMWLEHLAGKKNNEHVLWNVINLSAWWHKEFGN